MGRGRTVLEIDDDATRRRFLQVIGAGLLAGCASEGQQARPTPSPSSSGGFPARVAHRYGETVIPTAPTRVVTGGFSDHDALLALGVVPVAVGGEPAGVPLARSGLFPWTDPYSGGASPTVLSYSELDIEAVSLLKPDLITGFTAGMSESQYGLLSAIAPTVAQLRGYPDYFAPWQEVTRAAARTVGRPADGERLVADVERRFAEARLAHPEFAGASAAYAGVFDGGFYTENARSPRASILTSLGLVIPDEITALATGGGTHAEVSEEQLVLLDRDVLVWETGDPAQRQRIEGNPLYATLRAAREDRDVFVDDPLLAAALGFISVLSLPTVLDLLVPRLSAALT